MNKNNNIMVALVVSSLLMQGCATNLTKPSAPPQPASKDLSSFEQITLLPVKVAPAYADSGANIKASNKIEENLTTELKMVLPGLEVDDTAEVGLLIKPVIKEIKFIGGFARFMVGAMAGSSAVLMQVTYEDADTGEIIANPEFYQQASAMSGGYSIGASDNMMLLNIARDIAHYTKMNY